MCAQFTVLTEEELLEFRAIIAEVEKQLFNDQKLSKDDVRPSQLAAVVTKDGPRPMKWGFPGVGGKGLIINARSETVAEKKMFRDTRRCAIPATGFYEWGRASGGEQLSLLPEAAPEAGKKERYYFTLPGYTMFYLAGIYADDVPYPRFAVLTMAALEPVSGVHNRMPVLLRDNDYIAWLKSGVPGSYMPELAMRGA